MRSNASMYRARVAATTSGGIGGAGGFLSQPVPAAQSRRNCLSKENCGPPGCHRSAGQNRDESEVSTSSASTSVPSGAWPNSSLVSAMRMPRWAAMAAPRRYTSSVIRRSCPATSAPTRSATSSKVMNSSCSPAGALVVGVNTGRGSFDPSTRPSGSATPETAPDFRYSERPRPAR